ncbi:MAG: LysR substrate-binding domain-containing protein [Streptosporangiaceae bacterium]
MRWNAAAPGLAEAGLRPTRLAELGDSAVIEHDLNVEVEAVTQSGVSRALARLEAEVGTPLLRRSGRILRMTHAGAIFKRHVDAMLHQLDDGLAAVSQLIEPDTGTMALAFQHSLGTRLMPDLVGSFRAAHPDVRFQLTQVRDELKFAALDDGNADPEIGTRRYPDPATAPRPPAREPLRLALSRDHPLAGRDHPLAGRFRIRLADVSEDPFVSLRPISALRKLTDDLCEQAGFRPSVVFEGDDLSTVRGFVAAGLGVAILPAPRAGSPESAAGPVHYGEIADPGAVREIFLSWPAERRLLPAAELFRRHVIRRATAGPRSRSLGVEAAGAPARDARRRPPDPYMNVFAVSVPPGRVSQ